MMRSGSLFTGSSALDMAARPCQPFSLAGKRKGADDARALWPEVDRCLRALRPRYVLLENVRAVVAAGELGRVADSLASLGYRFAWVCLPASAVGAPHKRDRIFVLAVADTDNERHQRAGETWKRWSGSTDGRVVAPGVDWAGYTPAIRQWASILGRPVPAPTTVGARGGRVLNPALAEWMMGLPNGWITAVPGLSRAQQLRLAGNGVVPQQAIAAYRYLLDVLNQDARAAA